MDPDRFLKAQDAVWAQVLRELKDGRKTSHWMWFVFPQLAALGRSGRARFFGLDGAEDARAYAAAHPVLGARLREALGAAIGSGETDPQALFGPVDAMKLRSCLTLFAACAAEQSCFQDGLRQFYDGRPDPLTLQLLGR